MRFSFEATAVAGAANTRPGRLRHLGGALATAAYRHRHIHLLALCALAIAMLVGQRTGNRPDFNALQTYGFYLTVVIWLSGCVFAVARLAWLGFVERDPSPTRAFFTSLARMFGNPERIANSLNGILAVVVFTSAFSVLKGAIAILNAFSWDASLSSLDRFLLLDTLPYQHLSWLLHSPLALAALNFCYNLWFLILLATVFSAAIARRDTRLRHQFLLSFMLVWLVGGFFVATAFSSAGPCFFSRVGLGEDYQPLMTALAAADQQYSIWALSTQDMLWRGFTGQTTGSVGISAFPSMHVASTVLFALYASRRSRVAGACLWCFAAIIMVGSIALGWHYAVDGYAGAAISLAIWLVVGRANWLLDASGEDVSSPVGAQP